MKVTEIRSKAKAMGLKVSGARKAGVIRAIQAAEGNNPCFGTAVDECDQTGCCWRADCLPGGSTMRA